jgi:hypothetical protein
MKHPQIRFKKMRNLSQKIRLSYIFIVFCVEIPFLQVSKT